MSRALLPGVLVLVVALRGGAQAPPVYEWPYYGGDQAGTKYSALDEINRDTVARLEIAWEWRPAEKLLEAFGTRPGTFQNTPLMIGNVLYVSTSYNRVVALDADTGGELWSFDPRAYEDGQPPNGTGFVHRGVAAWRDGDRLRIFMNSRHRLFALDAATGRLVESFGNGGVIDLTEGLRWPVDRRRYTNTSPPIVYRNLVILGNGVADRLVYRNDPPGDVRAFDARTGKPVWTFHTVPLPGEVGHETWDSESWKFTGHTNVWAPMTLDESRGLLYLPVSTPSNDYYGVRRPGANLFAESIVCIDAATGRRKWHYQIVHHGLWDYDPPSPPNLVTIRAGGLRGRGASLPPSLKASADRRSLGGGGQAGRTIDAVVQLTKQGFAFVFDRETGEPVWPIEERPVPPSDVPREQAWPTQPFPTRPPPFADQGVSLDDAFDLTLALRTAAQAEMKKYRIGPLYTPPSFQGTLMRPGIIGGANWGGGAFDVETGVLYVKASNTASLLKLGPPEFAPGDPRASEVDAEIIRVGPTAAEFVPPGMAETDAPAGGTAGSEGLALPVTKPPYAYLAAIDLNAGSLRWRVPFGDLPSVRNHPALAGVPLPSRLGSPGASGAIVTRGGLVFAGGGDMALNAFDKETGREVWRFELPRRVMGTPMTYRARSGRQFIVVATGAGEDAALVAFALGGGKATAADVR